MTSGIDDVDDVGTGLTIYLSFKLWLVWDAACYEQKNLIIENGDVMFRLPVLDAAVFSSLAVPPF